MVLPFSIMELMFTPFVRRLVNFYYIMFGDPDSPHNAELIEFYMSQILTFIFIILVAGTYWWLRRPLRLPLPRHGNVSPISSQYEVEAEDYPDDEEIYEHGDDEDNGDNRYYLQNGEERSSEDEGREEIEEESE